MSQLYSTKAKTEKAFLVCTTIPKSASAKTVKQKIYKEHLDELELLTQTAGAEVAGKFYQERDKIDSSLFIGKGKAIEIAKKAEEEKIDLVIFENSLSPTQIRNLEKIIKCKVIDKPALILDIFATHARTAEAKTQVELAQLQYMQARLTRQWTHLSKQAGGIGTRGPSGTKGPGETQIETDRRLIANRISLLKEKLQKIEEQRKTQRQKRRNFTRIALVGYTNAGKSTLLNILTNAGVYVEDKLFATLDTSTKLLKEINGNKLPQPVLISDTVGFIRNLPHDLIESFKSTLAEVSEADLLLHVIDLSNQSYLEQINVVTETLKEINADTKNIIYVFNKVDLLIDEEKQNIINKLYKEFSNSVFISAYKGINLSSLYELIIENIKSKIAEFEIKIPANDPNSYKILNILHKETEILSIKYFSKIIKIKLRGNKISVEAIVHRYFNGNINRNINRPLIKNKIRKELAGAE